MTVSQNLSERNAPPLCHDSPLSQDPPAVKIRTDTYSEQTAQKPDRSAAIAHLRAGLCRLHQEQRLKTTSQQIVSTGISALDDILPCRGLPRGTLSEWISAEPGCGAASLAMRPAGRAQHSGPLIIVDRQRRFYAPAFSAADVDTEKTVLVQPESRRDELWALEQALRCPGIGAVIGRPDHLRTQEFRRLQLAAEAGTAIGLLIRPPTAARQSGWADVRLLVSPRPSLPRLFRRRLEVRCLYARGGLADQTVKLDICDETGVVCVAAEFSDSASALRAAGA